MKTEALRMLRRKLSNNKEVYGLWVTLESPSVTEMAVALGLDWIIIDAEHGHLDFVEILAHIRAAVRSSTVVLVRIAELQEGFIKRLLDIGADGIVVPQVNTAEQLKRAISYSKYPPEGIRGIGSERATGWGDCLIQHLQEANDNMLVVPIVESLTGGDNIKEMLDVPGVDIFFFGPADYCASGGYAGEWDNPIINEHIKHVKELVIKSGKYCGILTNGSVDMERRKKEGFMVLALGFDTGLLMKSLKHVLSEAGYDRKITTDLSAGIDMAHNPSAGSPPSEIRADRLEKISKIGEGNIAEIAPDVICEELVGQSTQAVNLFTAIVTFGSGRVLLPSHSHPHSESITLLSGYARVIVEDRIYTLSPLDNITIPRNCLHSVQNLSADGAAIFHVAMPTAYPQRTVEERTITPVNYVPDDFSGRKGPELVTRYKTAYRYPSGPGTEFIDYFNDELIPGVEMSGGYALFYEKGRLPAHLHNFDESICIIKGEATCFVEGRQYVMSGLSTAMQPRGRVHYFINNISKPMSMIWVYAGSQPTRIEVEESYAHNRI